MGWIIAVVILAALAFLGSNFGRFAFYRAKEKREAIGAHAGGVLFVRGGKTYYKLPKGTERKIADYEMDLTPASEDMQKFEAVMAEAYRQHQEDKRQAKKEAVSMMHDVAKEAME